MTAKTWTAGTSGAWAGNGAWSPAGAAAGGDDATVTAPQGAPGDTITGPGSAASLSLTGQATLSGSFAIGSVGVGTDALSGMLTVGAGSVVAADSATEMNGSVTVDGAGAKLAVSGMLSIGSAAAWGRIVISSLVAENGAAVQAGSLGFINGGLSRNDISVDARSSIEVGTVGAAAAGTLTVDAGQILAGAGDIYASGGVLNQGVILAQTGILDISGSLSGAGQVEIGAGATAFLYGASSEGVTFIGGNATLGLSVTASSVAGTTTYSLGETGTVSNFVQGDAIALQGSGIDLAGFPTTPAPTAATYTAGGNGTGTLAIASNGTLLGTLTLAGDYTGMTFQIAPSNYPRSYNVITTATAPTVPANAFLTTDTTASTSGSTTGDAYTGPVAGLARQYIWASPDGVAAAATVGNVFLHGGSGDDALSVSSGTNVLDGGGGSNFLTGATGADGGTDTFFVDGRGSGITWSTVNNFHHGDAVTIFGFQDGVSTRPWTAVDGAAGYQGATIHSELGGAGTGVNDSVTFAGISLADAQAKFTTSTGIVGGSSYLYIAYTG